MALIDLFFSPAFDILHVKSLNVVDKSVLVVAVLFNRKFANVVFAV